jgi:hypothetical protein
MRLPGALRRLAFDRNLPPSEALGSIRDAVHDCDHWTQSQKPTCFPFESDSCAR